MGRRGRRSAEALGLHVAVPSCFSGFETKLFFKCIRNVNGDMTLMTHNDL